jgi:CheY-like chemotaxis protein
VADEYAEIKNLSNTSPSLFAYSCVEQPEKDLAILENIQRIIVAEDQAVSLYLMKNQISELLLLDKTHFCSNGQDAVRSVVNVLANPPAGEKRPISIMLLDFQMPKKNGLDVVTHVRQLYSEHNQTATLKLLLP